MECMMSRSSRTIAAVLAILYVLCAYALPAVAVPMSRDPKGFEGIPWGAAFSETPEFVLVEDSQLIKGYELKQGPPPLGTAHVDSMRFQTYNGQFVRVVIRYHGKATHDQIVNYFQSQFGALDRTPGQISKGPVQQFNWQGDETEIVLTYESMRDRGIIFFENRAFALKFSEGMMAPDPNLGGATY
ncbi:MAG TPA: hypothetical protein VFQ34_04315 [Nitrospiraceae bacterium]|nr:hypothetical protein [Nitrospiraceae bacterium]